MADNETKTERKLSLAELRKQAALHGYQLMKRAKCCKRACKNPILVIDFLPAGSDGDCGELEASAELVCLNCGKKCPRCHKVRASLEWEMSGIKGLVCEQCYIEDGEQE